MNAVERGVVLSRGEYLDEEEPSLLMPESSAGGPAAASPPSSTVVGTSAPPCNPADAMMVPKDIILVLSSVLGEITFCMDPAWLPKLLKFP